MGAIRALAMIWQLLHTIEACLTARDIPLMEHVTLYKDLSVRIGKKAKEPLIISRESRELSHYSKMEEIEWKVWKGRVMKRFKAASGKGMYRSEEDNFIFLEFMRNM